MRPIRIHILPVGFTPKKFIDPTSPLVKIGADKIIILHSKIVEEDKITKERVEKTINNMKERFKGIEFEEKYTNITSFIQIVKEYIELLNRFGESDEVYAHLEGGERILGLALIYASFFSKKKVKLVSVLEYDFEEKTKFRYEQITIPPMKPIEITESMKRVLLLVLETKGQTLTDLARRSTNGEPSSAAPALFRHLKKLQEYNLVDFDPADKTYQATALAPLFIA